MPNERQSKPSPRNNPYVFACAVCGKPFFARYVLAQFCNERCRYVAKKVRQRLAEGPKRRK